MRESTEDKLADAEPELAGLVRQNPAFAGVKSFAADDGERLTIVGWRDEASLLEWRNLERHRLAQQTGRERWYQYYRRWPGSSGAATSAGGQPTRPRQGS